MRASCVPGTALAASPLDPPSSLAGLQESLEGAKRQRLWAMWKRLPSSRAGGDTVGFVWGQVLGTPEQMLKYEHCPCWIKVRVDSVWERRKEKNWGQKETICNYIFLCFPVLNWDFHTSRQAKKGGTVSCSTLDSSVSMMNVLSRS